MTIKLIIFDLSGVFFTNEEPPFIEQFAKEHNLPVEKFTARYLELVKKAEVGEMTGVQLWETILPEFGVTGDPKRIIDDMIGMKDSYPEMLAFAGSLKKHYAVVYLTNYNKAYWDIIKKKFDFETPFTWGVVSYEIGVRKPAAECFSHILERANVSPQEAIFIDDSPGNLLEAGKLGIQTIQFHDKVTLVKDLRKIRVLTGGFTFAKV